MSSTDAEQSTPRRRSSEAEDHRHEARGRDVARLRRRSRKGLLPEPRMAAGHRLRPAGDVGGCRSRRRARSARSSSARASTTMPSPARVQGLMLVVEDIDAARADLISRGVDVSEVARAAEPPGLESGLTRALVLRARVVQRSRRQRLAAPGGHGPGSPAASGRTDMDVAQLAELLHETAEHHGSFEAVAPPHDWWDWYAAYMDARAGREHSGRGLRRRRALHGGGQARRRVSPYSPLPTQSTVRSSR